MHTYDLSTEIGLGLVAFGLAFVGLGVVLFFDKGLLAMGNVSHRLWHLLLNLLHFGTTHCVPYRTPALFERIQTSIFVGRVRGSFVVNFLSLREWNVCPLLFMNLWITYWYSMALIRWLDHWCQTTVGDLPVRVCSGSVCSVCIIYSPPPSPPPVKNGRLGACIWHHSGPPYIGGFSLMCNSFFECGIALTTFPRTTSLKVAKWETLHLSELDYLNGQIELQGS